MRSYTNCIVVYPVNDVASTMTYHAYVGICSFVKIVEEKKVIQVTVLKAASVGICLF